MNAGYQNKTMDQRENNPNLFRLDPLNRPKDLDVKQWVDRKLPSEIIDGDLLPTANMLTKYRLCAIIQYRSAHYAAYIKVKGAQGQLR